MARLLVALRVPFRLSLWTLHTRRPPLMSFDKLRMSGKKKACAALGVAVSCDALLTAV